MVALNEIVVSGIYKIKRTSLEKYDLNGYLTKPKDVILPIYKESFYQKITSLGMRTGAFATIGPDDEFMVLEFMKLFDKLMAVRILVVSDKEILGWIDMHEHLAKDIDRIL